jgi:hypothetical protein
MAAPLRGRRKFSRQSQVDCSSYNSVTTGSNSHFDLWGSSQRFVEGEGGHELLPGREDDVGGDGSQVAEKSGTGVNFGPGFLPRLIGEVGNCVAGANAKRLRMTSTAARWFWPWPKLCSRL